MKILFAVNNESISESIIKKYQQEYKEIITSKNVYYFDAITRELQKDKTYDRIVISEDVEPFANNNYGVIDKFIFERLDNISDEATSNDGQDIPIILICADRRTKSENILVKLFGIGIYNALLGQDRTISNVCDLINKPRNKKDAKLYYRIDADDVDYKAEGEGDVNEVEIQNILNHYKRLGKNEEEYIKSFDNIAEQYTDAQLRVICKFLPLNVKAVLEAGSQKYQELITFGTVTPSISQGRNRKDKEKYVPNKDYEKAKKKKETIQTSGKIDVLEKNIGKTGLTKPVVVPKVASIKQQEIGETPELSNMSKTTTNMAMNTTSINPNNNLMQKNNDADEQKQGKLNQTEIENILQSVETDISVKNGIEENQKKKRGRPKKVQPVLQEDTTPPKRGRGRPKKVQPEEVANKNEEGVNLFGLGEKSENDSSSGELILPGLEENTDISQNQGTSIQNSNDSGIDLFGLGNNSQDSRINMTPSLNQNMYSQNSYTSNTRELETKREYEPRDNSNLKSLLSMSNKLVAFVGTSKNGTSFLVNSTAELLSKKGIKTAILDLTKNKNSYYIYTQNDEELRKIAFSCVDNLQRGIAKGIEVNKNLTVFTTLPDRSVDFVDYQNTLTTLTKNYSLVIMDCDYETDYAYFDCAQEIYLVQSYDILTIQPLTEFLRNLKSKNILEPSKLRIVLNKVLRVRSITERVIIGGMSSYNDPSMSYMTELFDKDNVKFCSIPFEPEAYSRYLDGLVNCEISTRGYPKSLIDSLDGLTNMMYPLLNNDRPANKFNTYNQKTSGFSSNINETLNRMKNRY